MLIYLKLIGPVLILYYLYYLEQEKCKCVMTWHHNYIKYYLLAFIVFILYAITIKPDIIDEPLFDKKTATGLLQLLVGIFITIIYLYSVYKYVGELDKTQCGCAIHDMKYLHNTLYYLRYLTFAIVIVAVSLVYNIISQLVNKLTKK